MWIKMASFNTVLLSLSRYHSGHITVSNLEFDKFLLQILLENYADVETLLNIS